MTRERRLVLYSGMVQGVGFRWSTVRALQGRPVTGSVRNLRDGRVELVVEGESGALDDALRAVREQLGDYIRDEALEVASPTGEFAGFEVRR